MRTIPKIKRLTQSRKRYKVAYGGRGSGKSYGFAQVFVTLGMTESTRILCTKETQNSLADSALAVMKRVIADYNLQEMFRPTKTGLQCITTGTEYVFRGLQHPDRIKSLDGIKYCWVEEATKVSRDAWQVLGPTIREDDSEIWVSFNPDLEGDPTYQMFVATERDDATVEQINYDDNKYLTEALYHEMRWARDNDTDQYLHVWKGEFRNISDLQVFAGKWRIAAFDTPIPDAFYYGADWGFSRDPTVALRCYIADDRLWIDHEAYGVGVDIADTPELFDSIPGVRDWQITADSARPETISHMKHAGFRVRPAKKGAGSVEDGIAFLRSFKEIVIHERCKHTADEFKLYSHKRDRLTGEVLPTLEDQHNHCIAAGSDVATDKGHKPIEDVRFGDMILTRNGYRMCLAAWQASPSEDVWCVQDSAGNELIGTGNHRVWTARGWVTIDALRYGDVVLTEGLTWPDQRLSSSKGLSTGGGPKQSVDQIGSTTAAGPLAGGCMLPCGSMQTALSRTGASYTTLTETHSTTSHPTYVASARPNMRDYIQMRTRTGPSTWPVSGHWPSSGTGRRQGESGTVRTGDDPMRIGSRYSNHAPSAASRSGTLRAETRRGSVETRVDRRRVERVESTTLSANAKCAESDSFATSIRRPDIAAAHVVAVRHLRQKRPVYDLSVDVDHEFFASGILVHNCIDALRYAMESVMLSRRSPIIDISERIW